MNVAFMALKLRHTCVIALTCEVLRRAREAFHCGNSDTAVAALQMPPGGLPNLPGLLAAQTGAGARPPGSAT